MTAPTVETAAASSSLTLASTARTAQIAISAAAMRDAVKLWPLLDPKRLAETWPGWLRAMILLTKSYYAQSSTAAGRSYRLARAQATNSPAPSRLIRLAEPPSDEWMTRAYGFSGPGQLTKDVARPNTALATTLGTASRIVMDGGRTTTALTVEDDPVAVGWYLKTDAKPCAFCALIASRGIVFKEHSLDRSNAKFEGPGTAKLHNNCHCILVPAFSASEELPALNNKAQDVYYDATRGLSGPRNFKSVMNNRDTTVGGEPATLPGFRKAWETHIASLAS